MQVNVLEYLDAGAARRCPDRVAVVDDGRSYTFHELQRYARQCAALLVRRRDVANQPVAVFLPKCAAAIIADLGIVYSGNFYTNLDVKSPPQRIRNILSTIRPALVVASRDLAPALHAIGVEVERVVFVEDALVESVTYDGDSLSRRLRDRLDVDPLCIINTSGSTGTPKGVTLSHRGTIDFMDWAFSALDLDGSERIGSLSPFYFDIFTLELNLCLAKGATIVIVPDRLASFPLKLIEFVAEQEISFVFWVPSIMVNISNQGLLERFALPALKKVLFAGEVFPMRHLNRWRRAIPGATFINLYGPIEITVDCTYFVLDREFGDDDPLPIGIPCRNTEILILSEDNRLCGVGEHGELCVRGTSLALGYWNDPEKTAKVFVQNPLHSSYADLVYRTGDTAFRNERGEIMFVGRKDSQIKHLGYRIELSEIEHQILRIEGIANGCVVYNSTRKEITLFYETEGHDVAPAVIRQALSEVLPKYMWPTMFYAVAELPRNPNGKVDRQALLARALETDRA